MPISDRSALLLSCDVVVDFLHHLHPIPVSRGITAAWLAEHAAGWSSGELLAALVDAVAIDRDPSHCSGWRPVPGLRLVAISSTGEVTRLDVDPDPSPAPARPAGFLLPGSLLTQATDGRIERTASTLYDLLMGQIDAGKRELVWELVLDGNHVDVLLALPRGVYEHWAARLAVLDCRSWGELRATVSSDVYAEVLELAGYDTAESITELSLTGVTARGDAHLPGPVPRDDEPFDASMDLRACAAGDWPPSVFVLMGATLPRDLLDAVAHRNAGMDDLLLRIPGDQADATLSAAQALGIRLTREPGLALFVTSR